MHALIPTLLGLTLATLSAAPVAQADDRSGLPDVVVPAPQTGPAAGRGNRPQRPNLPDAARSPPRPPGLGGERPPGHGGPIPRARPDSLREVLRGLARVCAEGGPLSAAAVADHPGRARARALVCRSDSDGDG